MENRFRMVIPLDGAVPESLPAPQFDQAASSARPVRPITEGEETVVHQRPMGPVAPGPVYQPQYAVPPVVNYVPQYPLPVVVPVGRSKGWGVLIALVIVFAAVGGLAGGYVIANYPSLTRTEPIVAAVTLRQRSDLPNVELTMPPEEVAEVPQEVDPEVQVTDPGDAPVLDPVPVTPDPGDPLPPPARKPNTNQTDGSGEMRPRRAPNSRDPNTTANRKTKSPKDNSNTNTNRRSGGDILTRIREIFEGKPQ